MHRNLLRVPRCIDELWDLVYRVLGSIICGWRMKTFTATAGCGGSDTSGRAVSGVIDVLRSEMNIDKWNWFGGI